MYKNVTAHTCSDDAETSSTMLAALAMDLNDITAAIMAATARTHVSAECSNMRLGIFLLTVTRPRTVTATVNRPNTRDTWAIVDAGSSSARTTALPTNTSTPVTKKKLLKTK